MGLTKIISYNVNGIRAAIKKGFVDWLKEEAPDLVCIQETKAQQDQVDTALFEALGYHHYWVSAQKKGYSGVCVLTKIKPDAVFEGMGIEDYDSEGRVIRLDFGETTLLNCYFPSGTSGDLRQAFKMKFLEDFYSWANGLRNKRPNLIIVGDYNIAHTENDIHNPVSNKKNSGFLPEERAWMSKWFENGFVDGFRKCHAERIEYSWWTYRANARANNKGWRIDYQSVSNPLADKVKECHHLADVKHSDHCPVLMEIELD